MYWTNWGNVARIEKASMDGESQRVLHNTSLIRPSGLTLDYTMQVMYWTDESLGRIESCNVDGSNRRVVASQMVYQPFGISVYRNQLYFTDLISGVNILTSAGEVNTIFASNRICEDAFGIELIDIERQPTGMIFPIKTSILSPFLHIGTNPCQAENGGCSHLCLLSSLRIDKHSCACPDGLVLASDSQTCLSNGNECSV